MNGIISTLEDQVDRPAIDATHRPLSSLVAPIREEMLGVEALLRRELCGRYEFVTRLVEQAVCLGGKRLRPALLLLSGQAAGSLTEEHLVLGAVMEMIHTATLVHDDVLDEAAFRRHQPTINAEDGNETSVLVGDFLFSHAFYLASTLESTVACQMIGRATNLVCQGEMLQIHHRGNAETTEEEYLEIIDAKTAELCACCCELGARYAGAAEPIRRDLARYGRNLGIAFQIADDLLDLLGQEDETGKSLGTDLEKQKLTLPLIHYLRDADVRQQAEFEAALELPLRPRRAALLPQLESSGSIAYAQERADYFARLAVEALSSVPAGPPRDILAELPQFVVRRRC